MNILFVGDVIGRPGRDAVRRWLPTLRAEFGVDFVIVNGENAAGGLGATPAVLAELLEAGADAITLGNHTWRKKELVGAIDGLERVIRPANFPEGVPGRGATVIALDDHRKIGIVNLVGRVFMEACRCPFEVGRAEVERLRRETPVVLVDMHAEATAEKVALGRYLDGTCTAVIGSHTHVQTADEVVLPKGTAYITDVGMAGPFDSVIGIEPERAIRKLITGIPTEFRVSKKRPGVAAVVIEADDATGVARSIRRIVRTEH